MSLSIQVITEQLKNLTSQRDVHATMLNKCSGAIDILNEQLKILESESDKEPTVIEGETVNGNSEGEHA